MSTHDELRYREPVMESEDEAAALAAELRRRTAERDELATMGCELRAERDALAARLREQPTVREIVGELREIFAILTTRQGGRVLASARVEDLLRRLDESQ